MKFFIHFYLAITAFLFSIGQIQASEQELTLSPGKNGMHRIGVTNDEANNVVSIAQRAFPALSGKRISSVIRSLEGYTVSPEQNIVVDTATKVGKVTETYIISQDFKWVEQYLKGNAVTKVYINVGDRI